MMNKMWNQQIWSVQEKKKAMRGCNQPQGTDRKFIPTLRHYSNLYS